MVLRCAFSNVSADGLRFSVDCSRSRPIFAVVTALGADPAPYQSRSPSSGARGRTTSSGGSFLISSGDRNSTGLPAMASRKT